MQDFLKGMHYFSFAWRFVWRKELRAFVLIPLLVNMILFAIAFALGIHWFEHFMQWLEQLLPSWLQWLAFLFWLLFVLGFMVVVTYTFSLLANLIAAPFNGLLSEKAELLISGKPLAISSWSTIIKEAPQMLKRQWQTIVYFLLRLILLLILLLIPLVQNFSTLLWFGFSSWMMVVQYMDYPMDNHKVSFKEMVIELQQQRALNLGFGMMVMVVSMIPFLNFVVMPVAVVGATKLYLEHY